MYLHPPPADFNKEILNDGALAELQVGLDPVRHRIILQHWFGWDLIDNAGVVVSNLREHQHASGLG